MLAACSQTDIMRVFACVCVIMCFFVRGGEGGEGVRTTHSCIPRASDESPDAGDRAAVWRSTTANRTVCFCVLVLRVTEGGDRQDHQSDNVGRVCVIWWDGDLIRPARSVYDLVASMVQLLTGEQKVAGSIPSMSTFSPSIMHPNNKIIRQCG